jgi:F-type H+-transporting ATPase subunit b
MQIDWITVAAQLVNFLILVWLLHRFLYRPIVRAMNEREERIAARLREAQERKAEAEREAEDYRSQQRALDQAKQRILADATQAAEATRRSLEQSARQDAERRRDEWLKQLDDDKDEFLRSMRRRSVDQVLALARRALNELAGAQLEDQLASSFARQLEGLEAGLRDRLVKASRQADGSVVVRSRFALDAEAQRRITRAVHKSIGDTAEVAYEQDDGMSSGIELKVGSQTLAWTIAHYLDEFEQRLNQSLGEVPPRDGRSSTG